MNALNRLLPWISLLAFASSVGAQTKPAQLQPATSEIVFTTRQLGVPVEGKFTRFGAQITLDPRSPQTGSVAFTIDTGSARFGAAEIDAEVPKPIWLNVAQFAQATFQSTSIKATGPAKFEVAGKLNIKGQVRDINVPVALSQSGNTSTATGTFTIKRLDFKVGEAEWADTSMLANDVVVKFKLTLLGLPAI
jgi:polyisoprenoid-binding protein YceI